MSSLERAVVLRGAAVVWGTVALLGLATAGLIHLRARSALDDALLVAAHGGGDEAGWGLDHARPPVELRTLGLPETEPEADRYRKLRITERPVWFDDGGDRVVWVVVERTRGNREEHRVVEARSPNATVLSTTGPFVVVYTPLAALAAAAAAVGLRWLVKLALAPLDRTRAELVGIRGPGSGRRLTEAGPEEVRQVVRGFNELLDRLEAAHRAQERFTAEAAHELRTPVTSLRLLVDLTRRHPRTDAEYRAAFDELDDNTAHLERLVAGLVTLARVDAGLDVAPAVRTVRELVASAVADEAPDAIVEVGDERVVVHEELAGIALRNLLRNAARHAPGAPPTVRSRREGDRVHVEVDDLGPGLGGRDPEALFDTLSRGSRARAADPGGHGLGLPLARRIARAQGGDCGLAERPGGGARATLTLPAA
jgi:signal transduction histidine kinase